MNNLPSEPADVNLQRGSDGRLQLLRDGEPIPVVLRRCFPWTAPSRFLSLRDDDHMELALIDRLDSLDDTSRNEVEKELLRLGFMLEITAVKALVKEIEIRRWEVEIEGGASRTFQTALDEWPRKLDSGQVLIRDVGGDLYSIRNPPALDDKSRHFLWALLD